MSQASLSTDRLVHAALAGDAEARCALLERHRAALRRMIEMRLDPKLRTRVDASDIVQDVMIEADRRLADYLRAARMPFEVWLRHLARDRLIDMHRHHRAATKRSIERETPLEQSPVGDSSAYRSPVAIDCELTPAAATLHMELEQRFQAALERMDPPDREVLVLRHFEQLSNSAVAEMLQLSEAAAAMRYLRAMRRLRALLHEA